MPRINIVEKDETLTTTTEQLYNVVYVPGFSTKADGIEAKTPTTFTSLAAFKAMVGEAAFPLPVTYEELGNWAEDAIPASGIMFEAGQKDPSYTYASSLLAQGVPVVYERVNDSTSAVMLDVGASVESGTITITDTSTGETITMTVPDVTSVGFLLDKTDGSDPETTWGEAPDEVRDPQCVNNEIFIQYKDNDGENSAEVPYLYNLYIYTGYVVDNGTLKGVWKPYNYSSYEITLSTATPPVPNNLKVYGISVSSLYAYLKDTENGRFRATADNELYDRNLFQIKYLTTGGYPVFEYDSNSIIIAMQALASPYDVVTETNLLVGRGDCIVIVDHTNNPGRPLIGEHSVLGSLNGDSKGIATDYTAMFSPWFYYGNVVMPGSFAYLISMSEAVKTNPNWLAIAGVNRGVIPGAAGLAINSKMTRAIADSYMVAGSATDPNTVFLNPITSVRPYGLTVWGNRTLADTKPNSDKALYYLNMRSLVTEIKKACYVASEQLMFEQNSDVLWVNFKSKITPLLDQMASSYGISGYKIIKETPDNKHQLKATIKIFPIYAVEDFDITVILTNDDEVIIEE